ncbi:MAG: ROK family transcriptional regulator [Siphonobacter sp.]
MNEFHLEEEATIKRSVVDYKKNLYRRNILSELYQSGLQTLAQLAKSLHSSIPSITAIVEELVEEGWVTTFGTATGNHGRRPVLFGLQPLHKYVIVLDISTHDTKVLILSLQREIVFRKDFDSRLEDSNDFVEALTGFITEVINQSGIPHSHFLAIGISMPGLVHVQNGLNYTYKSLNQASHPLSNWLSENFHLPVFGVNDTKATVLGEHRFGLARGKKHVLSFNIDWGVGLGIVLNGEIFQGALGFAGELGHIQVVPNGELCSCGKIGCLDTVTSATSLLRRVRNGLNEGRVSKLTAQLEEQGTLDIELVIKAAHQGDAFAIDLLQEIGTELGKGLSIAVHLFNPEIVIVDGVVAKAEAFITNPIDQAINKYCLSDFRNGLTVEISQLGERARWLGTHAYVMDQVLATL